jgi:outer membrane protein assembly factor BamB
MATPPRVVVGLHVSIRAMFVLAALLAASVPRPASGEDSWAQWRGMNRDGVSVETDILREWPSDGPTEVWRVPLGPGYASMSIVGKRLYTQTSSGGDEVTVCLSVEDGSEIWRTPTGPRYENGRGNGPRSTPTLHDGKAYVMSSTGTLSALDAETGDVLWSHDFVEEFGATPPGWGYSCSPLVEGDVVMVEAGGPSDNALVGYNKDTGDLAWSIESGEAAYSSPTAITALGRRQALFLTHRGLTSVVPATGETLWRYPWPEVLNVATPLLIDEDLIFVSAAYDKGCALVRITEDGETMGAELVWEGRTMRNHFNTSVAHGGYLYGFDNASLKCIEVETGEDQWRSRGLGKGSLIRVLDRLIVLAEHGTLVLLDAAPDACTELARVDVLKGRTWTPPCLAGGQLYLRNEEELVRLDIAARY